ncbi:glycosyltransferase [Haloplanus aerogenes]|uniref:Glycosyl transferase family 2 n=1 Tax=Haloplanus aerogenes TaxID=660522 RepID=A0A3M0DA03_9EURY|nr:glycosyltransferase [Haloplanus aerogenes]AZH26314.1 glycosyltransferase [Haloplanus aerogenes]RMB18227.1 glycosyl transferase family 2 [Haloplanus aerogenes]
MDQTTPSEPEDAPSEATLAVVVPVYNDPDGITRTLRSLDAAGRPMTVTVVDNASTDDTRRVVEAFEPTHVDVRLRSETAIQSSYAARNAGIRASDDADVLAFVDADVTVAEDYFDRALARLDDCDYLGCHVDLSIEGDRTLTARYNAHTGFPIEQYVERHRYAPTCSLLVRREVFEDVGLFDPRLLSGGDMEFGNRVDAAGYELGYCADAVATHPVRDSFRSLYDKNVRVGRGHCQLQRYYPERYGEPPIPPRHEPLDTDAPDLPLSDRLAFGALGTAMTAARASGYARELLSPTETGAEMDGPPSL